MHRRRGRGRARVHGDGRSRSFGRRCGWHGPGTRHRRRERCGRGTFRRRAQRRGRAPDLRRGRVLSRHGFGSRRRTRDGLGGRIWARGRRRTRSGSSGCRHRVLPRRSGDQRLVVVDCSDDLDAFAGPAAGQDHGVRPLLEPHLIECRAHAGGHVSLDLHVNLREATHSWARGTSPSAPPPKPRGFGGSRESRCRRAPKASGSSSA